MDIPADIVNAEPIDALGDAGLTIEQNETITAEAAVSGFILQYITEESLSIEEDTTINISPVEFYAYMKESGVREAIISELFPNGENTNADNTSFNIEFILNVGKKPTIDIDYYSESSVVISQTSSAGGVAYNDPEVMKPVASLSVTLVDSVSGEGYDTEGGSYRVIYFPDEEGTQEGSITRFYDNSAGHGANFSVLKDRGFRGELTEISDEEEPMNIPTKFNPILMTDEIRDQLDRFENPNRQ